MYQDVKQHAKSILEQRFPRLLALVRRYKIVIKYGISGGTAVVVNLSALYVFTDLLGIWYVASSVIAFCISLSAGFFLQKFWTFHDNDMRRIKRQMVMYTTVGVLNVILGPTLLYVVVETFGIWYMLAQFLVMVVLAAESYFLNRFITFRKETPYESVDALH